MKYILVTGASGGMGSAAVKTLAEKGYFVFALDRVACEKAENVIPVVADLRDEESILRAFSEVQAVTDELYAIVHFAGMYVLDSLLEMSGDEMETVFSVNVLGATRVNRIFLPLLRKGSRVLITTSELAPLDPLPFTGLYAVTKAALEKYAYSLRMEAQLLGISVSVLRPGAVKTAMLGASTDALGRFCEETSLYACNAERFRRIVEGVEAKNVSPERVANKVLAVLSKKNPGFVYSINRNPLLLLLNLLPRRLQCFIIRQILK